MLRYILLVIVAIPASVGHCANERIFEGPWNNRRTGSSGKMTCTATELSKGQWKAVFRGSFQGKPFEYRVDFQSRDQRNGSELAGSTTIDGKRYEWTGSLQASQLRGRYQATNGWNGEFALNETPASRERSPDSVEPMSVEDVAIEPVIQDGDHVLFIGNEFLANDGGVYHYLEVALRKRGIEITHENQIAPGKRLRDMVTQDVGRAMMNPDVNVVVITTGDLKTMKQFATKIKDSGKRLVVLMTWPEKHPGFGASKSQYTKTTRRSVQEMRVMEKETGATIIPAAVLYHDLTMNPPADVPRIDFLWRTRDRNQNAVGTMANALLMSAVMTGESPAGLNFDYPPHIVGQRITQEPELRLSRDLRETLQYRAWSVAQAWAKGRSHLE